MEIFTKDYILKVKEKRIELEFALDDNIAVLERGFHPVTGIQVLTQTQLTNSQHITDLIGEDEVRLAAAEEQVQDIIADIADKTALLKDVEIKEKEWAKLEKAKK